MADGTLSEAALADGSVTDGELAEGTVAADDRCGAPVTEEPGLSPRSPNIVVGPVFVTVEPASTEKLALVPRPTVAVAAWAPLVKIRSDSEPSRAKPTAKIVLRALAGARTGGKTEA